MSASETRAARIAVAVGGGLPFGVRTTGPVDLAWTPDDVLAAWS